MKNLLLIIFITFSLTSFAQTQSLKGMVTDKQSEYPLIGATVIIINSNPMMGTTTDIDGIFKIDDVPIGRHTIKVEYLGYEPITIPNIVVNSAKETIINLKLEENLIKLDEVVVTGQSTKGQVTNQLATVSARSLSIEEAGRFSGSFGDPARMAQNYAGVSGASDNRNDIIIRGNSPTGVLWRMEGIDIPSPSHFSALGTTGGPVSMLNINNLRDSDFFTGAWSADYGNALSGVFDIKLRNGNRDKREYLGQIGFNGFELGAEGPFRKGKKSSYLLNYRYSTLGVFKLLGIDFGTGSSVPEYQDLTFKLNFPTKNNGIFTLWGIGGFSGIHFGPKKESDDSNLFASDSRDVTFGSNTGVLGGSHTYFLNNNAYLKLTVVASAAQTNGKTDTVSTLGKLGPYYRSQQSQNKYSAHFKFNNKIDVQNTITTGVIYDYIDIFILDSLNQNNVFRTITDVNEGSSLFQGYINWQYRATEKLLFNLGLHEQYYALNNSNAIEPRFGAKYKLNKKATLSFGSGMHSQLQPIPIYYVQNDNGEKTNTDLDFSKAIHTVIGYDYQFAQNMRLKTELYYQYLYNIPVDPRPTSFSLLNEGADFGFPDREDIVNEGTGSNIGVEITLERFFSKGFYFLTTASIFDSKYKGSDDIERNSVFNGNFVFNALAGKEFTFGKNILSFDTKITLAGGKRYTATDFIASKNENRWVRDWDNAFEEQYTPYYKLDFKISYKRNGKHTAQEWSVDLTNVTNHKNIFQKGYSVKNSKETTTYQRGLFPNVLYRIYF